jgi:hypothetical protein
MLSHVYALKDIMSAIRAAAIIVHDYGVKEYKLEGGLTAPDGTRVQGLIRSCRR